MAEYKAKLLPLPKGKGGNGVNYSTEEHEIGTWIDGSKLYEKTISCGALPNTSTKNVSHNISNLNMIIHIEGIAIRGNNAFKPIPYIWSNVNSIMTVEATDTAISINTTADYSTYTNTYITLQYTKTS